MQFNHDKLLGKMREKKVSQAKLATEIGISETALWKKLHNRNEFTSTEILTVMKVLGIDDPVPYFFTIKVA